MREITTAPNSIFVANGYLQHAGGGFKRNNCLRQHVYFTPKSYNLPDSIAFSYVWSMGVDPENSLQTSTGTAERKELDNLEYVED